MLTIEKYDQNNNYRLLDNTPFLFHTALKYVLKGEKRFHVRNENAPDFDLVYMDNDTIAKADSTFPDSDFFRSEMIFPPYYFYDEADTEKINLDLLEGFDEIFFEETNEYSIVIARLALEHTALRITFGDERIWLFPDLRDRVGLSSQPKTGNAIFIQKSFYPLYDFSDRYCTTGLFHCLFLLQWITDLPINKVKYLELTIRKTEGIGSILSVYARAKKAFEKTGIQVFLKAGCTRYSDQMLKKYFNLNTIPEDSSEENTAYVWSFNCFFLNHFIMRHKASLDLNTLNPNFLNEMKEYADAVMGDRKILGVLLRGTDIILANFKGSYKPASMEECIRTIRERMEQYSYDKIFLATEDSDFLEQMQEAFPGKIIAISQDRFRVSDFKNVKYISDLEKLRNSGNAYSESLEDTTVNYYYAMYMLSRCESLIANCMCNGVNIANSFNGGKYARTEIISVNEV